MYKYDIIKKEEKTIPYFKLTIVGDINDADYITSIEIIKAEALTENELNAIFQLKEREGLSHANEKGYDKILEDGEYYPIDEFINIPHIEHKYCHTLKKVCLEYCDEDNRFYEVKVSKQIG